MKWRYQPVYTADENDELFYSMCECYFADDGSLKGWTEDRNMAPCGETPEELRADLTRMLADYYKWEPENHAALRVGMRFRRTGVNIERVIDAMERAAKMSDD